MKHFRHNMIRAGLEALYYTGAHRVLRPIFSGIGTIFMLHNVRPSRDDSFQPNRHLEVTPDFLRATLKHLRELGIDLVPMDELYRRLRTRDFSRRFACITLDDGYRDNRDFALPVFEEFDAPFTVFVASDFAEGTGGLWWVTLERLIAARSRLEVTIGGNELCLDTATPEAKQAAFDRLHDLLRSLPGADDLAAAMTALCNHYGVDETAVARELCLSWDELRSFAGHPLVTIGAHSISHCLLARQSETVAAHELTGSRGRIQDELQRPVEHLAYPYGDKASAGAREFALAAAAGFKTAVTTRPGMMFAECAEHLTALPRVSLNGHYQDDRLLPVLTSGAATAMWNGFRRVAAA
ncbi:polysaccharide deacetylase [Rhodopseudomonas thermotolerans]|uniref:Chitooligosaccharide deacetylase n=2 Tax=Rhodopseudomonas TaxID=1073 RepID=A0A336JIL6_9BRAD|nr:MULTISPECIES: polysaccharide deacetylase family protein [Rhodopseudomonas]RED38785.1 polysaccharide deacetylase [Rhodopseudomonas pentothenatexigens]REG06856.1 polysaccharide deacetylase [Rhodopseudomonas thermotolerans]SSW89605.1 polysaccharide deacetylase [Rhodopseudomonas pentothenatexigens]